ncbi:MAG: calcium/sodium antiporter [Saprospiraceae bacterium]
MIFSSFLLVAGLVLTLFSAKWLVDGASSIAKRFHVSDMVIGLTVVALGTSAPELVINVYSAIKGSSGLAIGNILGSNTANILLILGVAALISPLHISTNTKWKEIPFSLLAAIVLGIIANDTWLDKMATGNYISSTDGMVLLCFLVIFMVYTFEMARFNPEPAHKVVEMKLWKSLLLLGGGITGLFFGGKFLVEGAVDISRWWGLSERIIGLTIIAIGTSLPELATSIVAATKKRTDMAIGNIIGSNILNIFLVLGVTATIQPMKFESPAMNHDLGLVVLSSVLLFITTLFYSPRRIGRRAGTLYVILYAGYMISLIFVK